VSKSSNIRRIFGLLFVFAVGVVMIGTELFVSSASAGAPNTIQDETTRGGMMTSNSNSSNANMSSTRRRKRRRARAAAADTSMHDGMATGSASTRETSADPANQTDLSGTYTGTVNYPEGGVTGAATLTIMGNNFTLAPDGGGSPISGRVTAVTTRGYTGVTMMFGDTTPPPVTQSPPPLPAVSLRAKMIGGRVTLMSVPGEKREFSFSSAVMKMKSRRRH
jgi:hypothetical protein